MRLTMPEPKITLYDDGFDGHDTLNRKALGKKLSELVENISDPLVVALDGSWGSGKSHFLKCWVGEHLKREGNTTRTVYFDAFEHDYLNDPLIALTGVISNRFDTDNDTRAQKAWNTAKAAAPAIGRAALRATITIATMGVVQKADEIGDKIVESLSGDAQDAVSEFWQKENSKRAAMTAFKQALTNLTAPTETDGPANKLVIVIDELDRCRPDFALTMLEVMKHFFAVDNVHFVLGVNMDELQNSVKARYGNDTNAAKYLQKFVTVTMPIVGQKPIRHASHSYLKYFAHVSQELGFSNSWKYSWVSEYLTLIDHHTKIGLRDVERVVSLAIVVATDGLAGDAEISVLFGLVIMQIVQPELVEKARRKTLTYSDVSDLFGFDERNHGPAVHPGIPAVHPSIKEYWKMALSYRREEWLSEREDDYKRQFPKSTTSTTAVSDIIANYLDAFALPK